MLPLSLLSRRPSSWKFAESFLLTGGGDSDADVDPEESKQEMPESKLKLLLLLPPLLSAVVERSGSRRRHNCEALLTSPPFSDAVK